MMTNRNETVTCDNSLNTDYKNECSFGKQAVPKKEINN